MTYLGQSLCQLGREQVPEQRLPSGGPALDKDGRALVLWPCTVTGGGYPEEIMPEVTSHSLQLSSGDLFLKEDLSYASVFITRENLSVEGSGKLMLV